MLRRIADHFHLQADLFLKETGMHPDCTDLKEALNAFAASIGKGLQGSDSSFAMLPTYLSVQGELPDNEPVLVLDAGGTNLRVDLMHFECRKAVIDEAFECPMPGSLSPLTKAEYLQKMVDILRPFAEKAAKIGYCFSYSARILPNRDGQLEVFNKGVRVADTEGMMVCAELEQALQAAGLLSPRRWVLLNDSVATLFGGLTHPLAAECDGIQSFILGTGTNSCYSEKVANISRYPMDGFSGEMLINMEAGAYDGFPMGRFDKELHETDPQPGVHIYEKMVSGAYMGKLATLTIRGAAEAGLFSDAFCQALEEGDLFTTRELSDFLLEPEGNGSLARICQTESDRCVLFTLIGRLAERAAHFAAVNLLSVPVHNDTGRSPEQPALVIAEGSTFWRFPPFKPYLEQVLKDFGEKECGRFLRIVSVKDANLIGSAAAALLNA